MKDIISYKNLLLLWDFFNCFIIDFFETSVFKEVFILRYNSAVLIPKFQNKAIIYYTYIYDKLS